MLVCTRRKRKGCISGGGKAARCVFSESAGRRMNAGWWSSPSLSSLSSSELGFATRRLKCRPQGDGYSSAGRQSRAAQPSYTTALSPTLAPPAGVQVYGATWSRGSSQGSHQRHRYEYRYHLSGRTTCSFSKKKTADLRIYLNKADYKLPNDVNLLSILLLEWQKSPFFKSRSCSSDLRKNIVSN